MAKGFSVIVCTYNGINRLSSTIEAISVLKSEIDFEFLLVDNASTDGTREWVLDFWNKKNISIPISVVVEKQPGLMNARIRGIKEAKFDYLVFCDDDNELANNYLEVVHSIFEMNPKVGVIGGKGIIPDLNSVPDWFLEYQKSFAIGPQQGESGIINEWPSFVYGAGASFRKMPLIQLINSGYKFQLKGRTQKVTISGDDLELCWLMQLMGYQIYYSQDLKFIHHVETSRVNTDYLIKMKSGTSMGSALLFAYQSYFQGKTKSNFQYTIEYSRKWIWYGLLWLKNLTGNYSKKIDWRTELAMSILKTRFTSFSLFRRQSLFTYQQLKKFSENWVE